MATANTPQQQQAFGPSGLGSGPRGLGDNGGDRPPQQPRDGEPNRGHYAERMRREDFLRAMAEAGVRLWHSRCLHCGDKQGIEHRMRWRQCTGLCAFNKEPGHQHVGQLCPEVLRGANEEWCWKHANEDMRQELTSVRDPAKTQFNRNRAAAKRHERHERKQRYRANVDPTQHPRGDSYGAPGPQAGYSQPHMPAPMPPTGSWGGYASDPVEHRYGYPSNEAFYGPAGGPRVTGPASHSHYNAYPAPGGNAYGYGSQHFGGQGDHRRSSSRAPSLSWGSSSLAIPERGRSFSRPPPRPLWDDAERIFARAQDAAQFKRAKQVKAGDRDDNTAMHDQPKDISSSTGRAPATEDGGVREELNRALEQFRAAQTTMQQNVNAIGMLFATAIARDAGTAVNIAQEQSASMFSLVESHPAPKRALESANVASPGQGTSTPQPSQSGVADESPKQYLESRVHEQGLGQQGTQQQGSYQSEGLPSLPAQPYQGPVHLRGGQWAQYEPQTEVQAITAPVVSDEGTPVVPVAPALGPVPQQQQDPLELGQGASNDSFDFAVSPIDEDDDCKPPEWQRPAQQPPPTGPPP